MSLKLFVYEKLSCFLPETKFFSLKAKLLSFCGFSIDRLARIVSSVRFVGSFNLSVGKDTFVGHYVLIAGGKCLISIGSYCDIGPRVSLISGSHEIDMEGLHTAGRGLSNDIIIEDGVWIGASSTVLGGVRIGSKSIIAAGSTVIRDIPNNVIAAGCPCRVIKIWDEVALEWISVDK